MKYGLSRAAPLERLPQELLVAIFSECDLFQVLKLRQCSKRLEQISRLRAVWISILTCLTRETDVALAQFHPYHQETTSAALELAATARNRLYSRIVSNDTHIIAPTSVGKLLAPAPWRTVDIAVGGQWIAGIYGNTLAIYHAGMASTPPRLICEEILDVEPETELRICWGRITEEIGLLDIEEDDVNDNVKSRYRLLQVHIDVSTSQLRIEQHSSIDFASETATYMVCPSHPLLCMGVDNGSASFWLSGRDPMNLHPLRANSELLYYGGLDGIICTGTAEDDGFEIWVVPPSLPGPGTDISLRRVAVLDWYNDVVSASGAEYDFPAVRRSVLSEVPGFSTFTLNKDMILAFFVIIEYSQKGDMKIFHKELVIRKVNDGSAACSIRHVSCSIVPSIPTSFYSEMFSLDIHGDVSLLWFTAPNSVEADEPSDSWSLWQYAVNGRQNVKVAKLGFGKVDSTLFKPRNMQFCHFSGRGVNFTGKWLYLFDWGT
ncbi:hypothetical protein DL96DRAFT_1624281 [Flagelloscypha sp. PMI_526]|nr:hypothetical protein DL96DRAFT_1624281 [Flagelloscypha sp. PMI_526]